MTTKKLPLIFIVDDDSFFTELVKENLEDKHYSKLRTFSSGEECIDNLDLNPDIILLDHEMRGMNGIQTLKRIKKKCKDATVVFLTGQNDPEVARNALKHGAFDYLVKNEEILKNIFSVIPSLRKFTETQANERAGRKGQVWGWVMAVGITIFATIMAHDFILDMLNR